VADVMDIHACFRLERPGFSLNVDLTLPSRGVIGLFGHSGSGKTTLLRCIAGLERSSQGRFSIAGEVWQDEHCRLAPHKRSVGYVFQEPSLFPHLSVMDNLRYGMKRISDIERLVNLEHVVDLLGIGHLLERKPDLLSGGERQRVGIARALAVSPRLLLMDEPLAALDLKRKREILPYLENLHDELEIPMIYVSHSQDEMARFADHLVILEQGRVLEQGGLQQIFSRIDSPLQVMDDLGVVWQGRVVERVEQWHMVKVACPGGELWACDAGDVLGQTTRIRILARDVSLTLSNHEDTSILNRLAAQVVELAHDRDDAMALVRLQTGADHVIARLTRRSVDHLKLELGQRVWVQIKSVAMVR